MEEELMKQEESTMPEWYVLVDDFKKSQFQCKYNPAFEDVIVELASRLGCYVVVKKGDKYYMEIGDDTVDLGYTPDIEKICQEEEIKSTN